MKPQKAPQKHKNPGRKKNTNTSPEKWTYLGLLLIVAIVAYVVYTPALNNAFVWDDDDYIRNNPIVHSINLKEIFSSYVMGNYHPITILGFAIQYKLFALDVGGYHGVNILLHCLNTILVFYAIRLLCGNATVAIVASLLFGVHPLHVESVAWISELKDLLYTFFFLASYIFYLRFMESKSKGSYVIALFLFLFALMSKAMAASLPFLLLLTDYFKGRKFNTKLFLEKAPFILLALILGVVAIDAQKATGATDITVFPFAQRIVFACYGFVMYIVKMVVPSDLCAYYAYPVKPGESIPSQFFIFIFLFIGIVAYAIYSRKFTKKIFMGVGFFALTVFLVLQLLPVGGAIMADRYGYIPSIGIFYLAGEGFYWLWKRNKTSFRYPALILLGAATIFYSAKTYARCDIWENGMVLWNNVISQYQTIPQAYINRGVIYAKENKDAEALSDYNKAIQLGPNFDKAYNNRGILMAKQLKYEDAMRDYNKAAELNPKYASVYNNRGVLYKIQGDYEHAIPNYNRAIEINPNYIEALYNRGVAYRNTNKNDEALSDFNKVIRIQPDYINAYTARGVLYTNVKRYDDAFADFRKALSINPNFALAYSHRGNLYMTIKDYKAAISDYTKAIEIQPALAEPYYNRGIIEFDTGDRVKGCEDIRKAASMGLKAAQSEAARICP